MRYAVQGVDGCENMDELAPPGPPQVAPQHELGTQSDHPKACSNGPTAPQMIPRYTFLPHGAPVYNPPPSCVFPSCASWSLPLPSFHNQDYPLLTSHSTALREVVKSVSDSAEELAESRSHGLA